MAAKKTKEIRRGQTTSGVSGHIPSVRRSRTTFYKMWSGNVQFLLRCRMESKDDAGIVRIGLIGTYNSGSGKRLAGSGGLAP